MGHDNNMQDIFDRVTTHLLTQLKKSKAGNQCLYRGDDDTMCAVGCLITDEAYTINIECFCADSKCVTDVLEDSGVYIDSDIEDMLVSLQLIHDDAEVFVWFDRLALLSQALGLKFNPPTAIKQQ